jgi:hypothetical protein
MFACYCTWTAQILKILTRIPGTVVRPVFLLQGMNLYLFVSCLFAYQCFCTHGNALMCFEHEMCYTNTYLCNVVTCISAHFNLHN